MDFLNIILNIFIGSFTALYTFIQENLTRAVEAGLTPDWNSVAWNAVILTIWIGSPFAAASIAESREKNRFIHFILGFIAPWVYPVAMFFMLPKAHEYHPEEKNEADEDMEDGKASRNEVPESHLKNIDIPEGENLDGPQQTAQMPEEINAKYFGKLSTDESGNSLGPYLLELSDGKSIHVTRIVDCLPEVVVFEIEENGKIKTIRFPYAKIKCCKILKRLPGFQKPATDSSEISFVSDSQAIQSKVNVTEVLSGEQQPIPGDTLKPGEIVGNCRIVKILGKGGMSTVYLAKHSILDISVAMKIFSGKLFSGDVINCNPERFLREAKLAARIKHPNVVAVMDAGHDEKKNIYYIVLEYIDGGTLGQLIRESGSLDEDNATCLLSSIGNALDVARKHNVVHRDIKPDNIMLTSEGVIKLADLGLAKEFYRRNDKNMTTDEFTMGSPAYMSPEQAKDFKNVDFRTDIYSLGATLYHAITGKLPYTGDSALSIVMQLINDPVPDPRLAKPEISEQMARITMKMMAKNPANRYQTPQELLEAVAAINKSAPGTPGTSTEVPT